MRAEIRWIRDLEWAGVVPERQRDVSRGHRAADDRSVGLRSVDRRDSKPATYRGVLGRRRRAGWRGLRFGWRLLVRQSKGGLPGYVFGAGRPPGTNRAADPDADNAV